MGDQKRVYCFISDENKKFHTAIQQADGTYAITKNSQPFPIKFLPPNIIDCPIEFGTNKSYFSLVRSVNYPLNFIKDGYAILSNLYYLGRGPNEIAYLTIIEWNGIKNIYELSYYGRFDFYKKVDNPKTMEFSIPTLDDSVWGILSQKDSVKYSIECNENNPKAIRVLFDGITFLNKYTFQTVQSPITKIAVNSTFTIPFVLINQDGDSSGIITKNQTYLSFDTGGGFVPKEESWFLSTAYAINGVNIAGAFMFSWSTNTLPSGGIAIYFITSLNQKVDIFSMLGSTGNLVPGKIYNIEFNFNLNLAVAEKVWFIVALNDNAARHFTITPITTNIFISTKTKQQPTIAYGLRQLDLLEDIVSKATNNRYSINSLFFTVNNKDVCLSGDSIRGIKNAKIYSSFKDFFVSFDAIYFMALRNINDELWIERADEIYKNSGVIIDLKSAIDLKIETAEEFYANEIIVGSPKQDYRHPSGRLEFNSENTFSIDNKSIDNKLNFVSYYRLGCYDIQFLILDYQGQSTQDNSGDKSVYVVKITDDLDSAKKDIETFENINIDNAILQPIIKVPLDNDVISFNKPFVSGVAPALSNINIYVDTVLDGNTTADANGNWTYNINTALTSYVISVTTGIHVIEATYTNLAAPKSTITVNINTSFSTAINITYPNTGDNIYNNLPLIKGTAQSGTNINISLNGTLIGSVVANASCRWTFQSPVIPNGNNTLSVNSGVDSVNFNVDSNVSHPLITYVGSELDGFVLVNNLPLIKGVAAPGTSVDLWLSYIRYAKLNTTTIIADSNGNWSYQVIPVSYNDIVSGIPVLLAPIHNGLVIISTSLINYNVSIVVTAYKLSRPAYSSITGVIDNTVYNTEYSPKRMLMNHRSLLASITDKQKNESIVFQTADKNSNLRTVLNGEVIAENDNVANSSLGTPIAILEYVKVKINAISSFSKILEDFRNGGLIKFSFKGNDVFALPIGSMKMKSIMSDVQEWSLLLSPATSYISLLNMYKNGTTINVMKNSIYHSDYNTLHFVTYNFIQNPKFNFKSIYQDWFENRNDAWLLNPFYEQKIQTTDTFRDQIITNGVSSISLQMYRCSDIKLINTFFYNSINPAPINPPNIVLECIIDMSLFPEDTYFFVMVVGSLEVSISERIQTKNKFINTILLESSNSSNKVMAFFSTGFKTVIRVEGHIKKLQPSVSSVISRSESGDQEILYGSVSRKRTIRFGTAYGLPDYIYLKIADALVLDNLLIENVLYTLDEGEKIEPSDDVDGHPLFYYNVNLSLNTNTKGNAFAAAAGANTEGVVLVVDATAFGLPTGSLINIGIDNG